MCTSSQFRKHASGIFFIFGFSVNDAAQCDGGVRTQYGGCGQASTLQARHGGVKLQTRNPLHISCGRFICLHCFKCFYVFIRVRQQQFMANTKLLATICGKMRRRWVRITAGDRVKMEMSPYDLNKGRITWRLR